MGICVLQEKKPLRLDIIWAFSGNEDARNVGKAFEMFPIAFALSVADMEATYFIEGKK